MRHHIFHASGSVEGHWIRIPPPHKTSFDASDTYDMKEDESLFALSGIVSFQERGRGYKLDTAARHGSINCIRVHDIMEHVRQDEIEDLSLSPPAVGSMQIAGSNGFVHNIEFMSQAYLRNRSSKINIEVEDDTSIADKDQPLPIFLKWENNPVKDIGRKIARKWLKKEVSAAIGLLYGMAAVVKKEAAHSALPKKGALRKGRLSYGNETSKVRCQNSCFRLVFTLPPILPSPVHSTLIPESPFV
ncbi:hypothetical protein FXO38_18081 [Capsicum annuum]|nr:hypothetical protein FXO38_18081 [Capsicum annuum]KAF3651317.1 hypothetical protein FXO37_18063 [Capsicum annuum]